MKKNISPIVPSILLLYFAYSFSFILFLAIHELGHALVGLIKGYIIERFVVHPFFVSYVLLDPPTVSLESAAAGTICALSVSFVLFILLWKRRSISSLSFLMIFPVTLVMQGIEATGGMANPSSDMSWVMYFTGLPAILFYVFGCVLIVLGIFFFLLLFPLIGLAPEDKKSFFVVPIGISLYSCLVVIFSNVFEPVSHEIALNEPVGYALTRAYNYLIIGVLLGVILSILYFKFYHKYFHRLPQSLQTEKVFVTSKDVRIPGIISTLFIVLLLLFLS
jgi:hypothetical protein